MLELKQTQRLAQQLVLTRNCSRPSSCSSFHKIELVEAIEEEIKENPVLEVRRGGAGGGEEPKKGRDARMAGEVFPSEDSSPREERNIPTTKTSSKR